VRKLPAQNRTDWRHNTTEKWSDIFVSSESDIFLAKTGMVFYTVIHCYKGQKKSN